MSKLYQFRGEVFVHGTGKEWEPAYGEWLLTVDTEADLNEDSVLKVAMFVPKEMQVTEQKKRNFIARIFA